MNEPVLALGKRPVLSNRLAAGPEAPKVTGGMVTGFGAELTWDSGIGLPILVRDRQRGLSIKQGVFHKR